MTVTIGSRVIGGGRPAYVIAEIGLNHNGDVELAKQLIDVAADAGADAVKFQKRTPEISTPGHMRDVPRETPWGTMTYLEYRHRVEFGRDEYIEVGDHATMRGLEWFASPWDVPSVDFLEDLGAVAHKVASASVTDIPLLEALRDTGWRDYSLHLSPDGLLVGHLETDDYAAAQEAMARTAVNPRWQAEMSEFFVDPGNPDEGFQVLDEVFHLEDQLRAAGLPTTPQAPTA